MRLYLSIREDLDGRREPAMIRYKTDDLALVMWDARATRLEITDCIIRTFEPEAITALAAGLDLTFPLPDWTTRLRRATLYVPPALRLPGHPAIQGGAERRRRSERDFAVDRARWDAERLQAKTVLDLQAIDDRAFTAA